MTHTMTQTATPRRLDLARVIRLEIVSEKIAAGHHLEDEPRAERGTYAALMPFTGGIPTDGTIVYRVLPAAGQGTTTWAEGEPTWEDAEWQ